MSSEVDTSGPETQVDLPTQVEDNFSLEEQNFCSELNEDECEPIMQLTVMNKTTKNLPCKDSTVDYELSKDQTNVSTANAQLSSAPNTGSGCSNSDKGLPSGCKDSSVESSTEEVLDDQHVSKVEHPEQDPVLDTVKPSLDNTSLELQNLTVNESVPQPPPDETNDVEQSVLTHASLVEKKSLEAVPDLTMPNLSQPPPPLPSQAAAAALLFGSPQNSTVQQPPALNTLHSHQQASSNITSFNSPPIPSASSQLINPIQASTQISQNKSRGNGIVTASPLQSPTSQTGPTVTDGRGVRLVPNRIQALLHAIFCLQSPDDLQVHCLASQLRALDNEAEYRWLCEGMCSGASNNRRLASVVGAVCREAATYTVGSTKLRTMVFRTAQQLFANHEELAKEDHEKFVTCAIFLGEIFYYVRSETGTPFAVLAEPLVVMLKKILQIYMETPAVHTRHLSGEGSNSAVSTNSSSSVCNVCSKCGDSITNKLATDTETLDCPSKVVSTSEAPVNGESESSPPNGASDHQDSNHNCSQSECKMEGCPATAPAPHELARHLDSDMMVVAKQLLQNGESLQRICPDGVADIVQAVTELLCRCSLSSTATLQVCAALAEMWPWLCTVLNPRTSHAVLASKMGLSLNL